MPATDLVCDCCVNIEVKGSVFYGLSEENSVLPKTRSLSFKYK